MAESGGVIHVKGTDGTTKDVTLYTDITDVTEVYKEFKYNGATVYASTTTEKTDELATELAYLDGSGVSHYLLVSTPETFKDTDRPSSGEACDLTEIYAGTIHNKYNDNPWAFVTDKSNVDDIILGDYIPIEVDGYTYDMEIACINCYEGECYDNANPVSDGSADGAVTTVPSHIDIISKQLYNTSHAWYSSNNNNGSSSQQCPWLHSTLYSYLQDTVFPLLPQELQDVAIEKCMLIEQRYSSSGTVSSPTGECWQPIGKLWIPNEVEIFGSVSYSSTTYGNYGVQYETFDSSSKRIRYRPSASSADYWWSLSPNSAISSYVVYVRTSGSRYYNYASLAYCFPLCLRLLLA